VLLRERARRDGQILSKKRAKGEVEHLKNFPNCRKTRGNNQRKRKKAEKGGGKSETKSADRETSGGTYTGHAYKKVALSRNLNTGRKRKGKSTMLGHSEEDVANESSSGSEGKSVCEERGGKHGKEDGRIERQIRRPAHYLTGTRKTSLENAEVSQKRGKKCRRIGKKKGTTMCPRRRKSCRKKKTPKAERKYIPRKKCP